MKFWNEVLKWNSEMKFWNKIVNFCGPKRKQKEKNWNRNVSLNQLREYLTPALVLILERGVSQFHEKQDWSSVLHLFCDCDTQIRVSDIYSDRIGQCVRTPEIPAPPTVSETISDYEIAYRKFLTWRIFLSTFSYACNACWPKNALPRTHWICVECHGRSLILKCMLWVIEHQNQLDCSERRSYG